MGSYHKNGIFWAPVGRLPRKNWFFLLIKKGGPTCQWGPPPRPWKPLRLNKDQEAGRTTRKGALWKRRGPFWAFPCLGLTNQPGQALRTLGPLGTCPLGPGKEIFRLKFVVKSGNSWNLKKGRFQVPINPVSQEWIKLATIGLSPSTGTKYLNLRFSRTEQDYHGNDSE